jgi:membrane fusion protein (multidrug efflux system)
MTHSRAILLSLLFAIPVIAGIGYWLFDRQHYETTDDAYLKSNIVLISPKVQGYVTQLSIDDNQAVKKMMYW